MTWERALAQLVNHTPRIERRAAGLDLPVDLWRGLLTAAAARDGLDVRSFVVPEFPRSTAHADQQLVVIVLLGRLADDLHPAGRCGPAPSTHLPR